jgi:ubiquinone/menaquinone biosynthesis C-methylase UbiE
MGQVASVRGDHERRWRLREEFLKEALTPIANRPQVANLPHAISALEGYRLWAESYDEADNALLALEMRALSARMEDVAGYRILDAGSGTGRWMQLAQSRGARVFGVDACREMVLKAERKPGLGGRSALADIRSIPIQDDAVDLSLCSFTLGYLPSPGPTLRELARVSREVIVSDLHPGAALAGWTRSFRAGDRVYQLHHYEHSIAEIDHCARSAGLFRQWRVEASFAEPEREIFRRAGKDKLFDDACRVPAVLITVWRK